MNSSIAIDIKTLVFAYQPDNPLLRIDDWQVQQGEHVFLHGASGSGKTTLLNLLSGILTPQSGEIRLLGQSFSRLSTRQRDHFRAQYIGVIFQSFNLIPYLSIEKNIALARYFAKDQGVASLDNDITMLFSQLQLDETLRQRRADSLSVGQQQRVAIARALINRPKLIIADEPTSALDSDNRDRFIEHLLSSAETTQASVIFVSHERGLRSHFTHVQAIESLMPNSTDLLQ